MLWLEDIAVRIAPCLLVAVVMAACSKTPQAPAQGSAPASVSATAGLEPIPGVTTLDPAPVAAPAAASPSAHANVPPAALTPTGDWGQVLSEKIEGGTLETTVQSPWGPVTITGPSEGAGGAVTRYWQAWAKIDFGAIYPMTTGVMRERLAEMDTEAGRADYRSTISDRYKDNAPIWFKVEGVSEQGDRATALVRNETKTGEIQTRECTLVKTPAGWRFEQIRAQR